MLSPVDYAGLETRVLALRMIGLRRSIEMLELQFSELAAQMAKSDYWELQGSNSAVDWIRFECKLTEKEASARVRVGELVDEMPQTVRAMEEGAIGFAHLSVMARTAEAVGEAFDEKELLPMEEQNSPGKFYFKCLHYRHALDAKGYCRDQERLAQERALHLSRCDDGCLLIHGVLDPVAGLTGAPGAENEFSLPIAFKTVGRWACDRSLSRVLLQDSGIPRHHGAGTP